MPCSDPGGHEIWMAAEMGLEKELHWCYVEPVQYRVRHQVCLFFSFHSMFFFSAFTQGSFPCALKATPFFCNPSNLLKVETSARNFK